MSIRSVHPLSSPSSALRLHRSSLVSLSSSTSSLFIFYLARFPNRRRTSTNTPRVRFTSVPLLHSSTTAWLTAPWFAFVLCLLLSFSPALPLCFLFSFILLSGGRSDVDDERAVRGRERVRQLLLGLGARRRRFLLSHFASF
jgi:hypothetical protein